MTVDKDAVAHHARVQPQSLACIDLEIGERWNYADLDSAINKAAGWLEYRLGAGRGQRVATLARNSALLLLLHLACARAGAIYTPFNWRLAPPEIARLIADAMPSVLVCDEEFAAEFYTPVVVHTSLLRSEIAGFPPRSLSLNSKSGDEPSTLLYTSGTSGTPKGVLLTENNAFWGCMNFVLGNQVTRRSVFLCDMPMFHTAGLFAAARSPLLAGGTVLISKGFDPIKTLSRIADPELAITHYFSVPQMAQAMWQLPNFEPRLLQGLTVYAMGGAPNPSAQIERFVRAGIKMSDGFGMTETGSNFGMPVDRPELLLAKAGSCGLPYLFLQSKIVDDEGKEVDTGIVGELWVRGPCVTSAYWNRPGLTDQSLVDGWFKTGDLAMRDTEGFYYLVDRKKDMYISGGENVYPAEVEAAILELHGVAEVGVIGIPDVKWGECGVAYVVLLPGFDIGIEAVLLHCQARVARFKVPADIVFVQSLPRTASGKVQKQTLKAGR